MGVFSWIGNLVFETEEGEQTQLFGKILGRKKNNLTGIRRKLHIEEIHYLY
jgi:hypothetical protein